MHYWNTLLLDPILNILIVLSKLSFNSFGLAIIELALISRLIVLPLTQAAMRSSQRMAEARKSLGPILERVRKKYAGNRREMQAEISKYEKEAGVSPLGCLFSPTFISLLVVVPVFLACSRSIRRTVGATPQDFLGLSQDLYSWPVVNGALPVSSRFLWFDLARPDPYFVLPILVAVFAWVSLRMAAKPATDPQQQLMQSVMQIGLPVLMAVMTATFPAGLGVYLVAVYVFSVVNGYFVYGWGGLYQQPSSAGLNWSKLRVWPRRAVSAVKSRGIGGVMNEVIFERSGHTQTLPASAKATHIVARSGRGKASPRGRTIQLSGTVAALGLAFIVAYAVFIRFLHLLNRDHYFILSNDSYVFHWEARRILSGESVPWTWHSGLTYPLAWTAELVSWVGSIPLSDALDVACKILPVLVGIASLVMIYAAVSRIYDRVVALFAAFAWGALTYAAYMGAAGYLDRDAVSVLLFSAGCFVFYFSRRWHVRVSRWDVGWVLAGAAVLAIEVLLFVEWNWLGPVILLIVLASFVAAEALTAIMRRTMPVASQSGDRGDLNGNPITVLGAVLRQSSWRPLVLILGVNLLGGLVLGAFSDAWSSLQWITVRGGDDVSELQSIGLGDIIAYGFLLIPLCVGIYAAVTRLRRSDAFILAWFFSLFVAGLFAVRLFLFYAAPAACVLVGLGLATLWGAKKPSMKLNMDTVRTAATVTLVVLIVLLSLLAYNFPANPRGAPTREYAEALVYIRENSPEDAVVISWWDFGYFVLDLADRLPVVDGGYMSYPHYKLVDIGKAYLTTDPSEAASIMRKYSARYMVFSKLDVSILPVMSKYAYGEAHGDGVTIPVELQDSFYSRALSGDVYPENGFTLFYPSPDVKSPEVVILELVALDAENGATDASYHTRG